MQEQLLIKKYLSIQLVQFFEEYGTLQVEQPSAHSKQNQSSLISILILYLLFIINLLI